MSRFPRSRGAVSRAASALLFICAALAVVVFPEGEAGGLSGKFGFRPAQIPVEALAVNSAEYDNPLLCADLGGKIENSATGENICSEIDLNDTFCIVGADEAFPCRGLFKHVITCNAEYNRPALNPFFCGARCDENTHKARGTRCERFFPADEILPEAARSIIVAGLIEGAAGTIATLQAVLAPSDPLVYGAFEIVNHRPAAHSASDGLTIVVDGGNRLLQIAAGHRLGSNEAGRTVVAKSFCSIKEGSGADAKEKCYPTFLTIAVEFSDVVPRVDIALASVVAEADRNVSINVAEGYSGPGYRISLVDAAAYDLTGHRYNPAAHEYDAGNDIIVIDSPIDPANGALTAAVTADVACLDANAFCRDAELTVTVIFHPVQAASQRPVSGVYRGFAPGSYVLPAQYSRDGSGGARAVDGVMLTLAGVNGYAGDLADLGINLTVNANDSPVLSIDGPSAPAALAVGEYTLTVALIHETLLLGTLFADIPLSIRQAIPPDRQYGLLGGRALEVDITVVGDYADEIYEVEYSGSQSDGKEAGALILPDAQPDGFYLELSENGLGLTVRPAVPVRAGVMLEAVVSVTVTVNQNYELLAQPLNVRVSALSRPDAAAINGESPYGVQAVASFGSGPYDGAVFGKESGSESLTVDAAGVVSVIAEIANPGLHSMVVTATSAGFLGVARFEVELNVEDADAVPSDFSIPTPDRKLLRVIGPDYYGTVAFFAAASVGVTLVSGDDDALDGFSFVTEIGADATNSQFVAPDGFLLSVAQNLVQNLAQNLAPAGRVSVAAFEVAAKHAGRADTAIALEVTVSVLSSPEQVSLRTNTTADFEHPLVLPEGYEYGASLAVKKDETDNTRPPRFQIVDGKLKPTDAARDLGESRVEVVVTHPDFYGEVVLTVTVYTARVINADDFVANRDVTVTAAIGHYGPGYQFPVDGAKHTVVSADYDSAAAGYDTETNAVEILSGNPVGEDNLTVEIAAVVDCVVASNEAECARETILLSVTFVPLSPLTQTELNEVYDENFAHPVLIPGAFQADAVLSVAGVQGGSDDLFTLSANREIVRNTDSTPPARDGYVILMEMTHAELLGTLSFQVTANISPADLDPAAHRLTAEKVYVAAGHAGGLYQNIILPSSASADAVLELPDESPAGLSLVLTGNQREAEVELVDAISGEIVRNVTLNVTRGGNYNDLEQVVALTVTALGIPPLVRERGTATQNRPFNRSFRNLAAGGAGGYQDGNYAGGFFEDRDESPDLGVSQAGVVFTEGGLGQGDYDITIAVYGRPNQPEANFAGTAAITVQLSVTLGVVDLTEDEVVLPAARNVVLDAVAGYFGRGYAIPVEAGHTLVGSAQYDFNSLAYDDVNKVISILDTNSVGTDGLTLSLVASGDCADDATANQCNNVNVSIVAAFRVVAAPVQAAGSAAYREDFTVSLALPAGYEREAGSNYRVLEVAGVVDANGRSLNLADISLNVNGDDLEYTPDATQGSALDAGEYKIAVELSQTDPASAVDSLLGTLTLEVDAAITPRDLDPANFGLSAPGRATITVAAGAGAIGEELTRVSLSESAAGAIVILPEVPLNSVTVSLAGESSVAVFYLTAAVAGGAQFSETAALAVTLNDNHNLLAQPVALTVSALRQPAAEDASGQIPLNGAYLTASVFDFRTVPDYANAVFVKAADAENRASLTVSAEGVVGTETDGITRAGPHTIVVEATSPDYVGAARLEMVLDLVQQGELQSGDTIPLSARTRLQPVAPGYAGSVAFFAAGRGGVTLETPANPEGFNFGTDGANRDYAGRDGGFTLYVNEEVAVDAGDTATASFNVIAKDAGGNFADDEIAVAVTVSVLGAPTQEPLDTNAEDNFNHALVLDGIPGGLGGETGALAIVGVVKDGAEDGTDPFRLEGANLRPTDAGGVVFGDYKVSISWTHPKFLGELTLAVTAEIVDVIEPDAVVAAAARNATVTVVTGYDGEGYVIPLGADYEFVTVLFDDAAAGYDKDSKAVHILSDNRPAMDILTLAVTATVDCQSRKCARRALTVSVAFVPLQPFAQTRLTVDDDREIRHPVNTGAYGAADVVVVPGDGAGASDVFDVEETAPDSGVWEIVRGLTPPGAGEYTIFLEMTDETADGFKGSLPLAVTASIRKTVDPAAVVAERNPMVDAAAGYVGSAYTILVGSGYVLTSEVYDPNLMGYDAENKVISIVADNPVPDSGQLILTLTGEGLCADPAEDCRTAIINVTAVFPVIDADQDAATAPFKAGWTVSLKFPAGYGNGEKAGRNTRILHPLPRTGDIVADQAACEALGGAHNPSPTSFCKGYATSMKDELVDTLSPLERLTADLAAKRALFATSGVCSFDSSIFDNDINLVPVYYSCHDAFAKARDCNANNQPAANNTECGTACAADEFALGGKCLALKLSADGDQLEHAPSGAADALNAKVSVIVVEMTETDLLGAAMLEVETNISPIQLAEERFGLSAPERAVVTIAAGDGAVGLELARISLTVVDATIDASIVDPVNKIQGKILLSVAPPGQTVVFYLNSKLGDMGGEFFAQFVQLTISSSNANYDQLARSAPLNLRALNKPVTVEKSGVAGPANRYSNLNLHNFKDGDYKNATAFEWDESGSEELTVSVDGIVSTTEEITLGGTYNLAVSVISPDYVGAARLELRLLLTEEGVLTPDRTILASQRGQIVPVVPGYSGSVAFFEAVSLGVTLRTPADPTDFSFGTGGANRDYEKPDGFTLFLDGGKINAAGETAVAEFAVTADAAGFTAQEISLAVTVLALTVPGRASLTARVEDWSYGAVAEHADYPVVNAVSASIAGVAVLNSGRIAQGSLSNHGDRVQIAGAMLSPVDPGNAEARLKNGWYRITVEMTHAGFRGTLTLEVEADIQETLDENDIVALNDRQTVIVVAEGYSGKGHTVVLEGDHVFEGVSFESDVARFDRGDNVYVLTLAVTRNNFAKFRNLAVTATVNCAPGRNCAPLELTVSATFIPQLPYLQTPLIATEGEDFPTHPLNVNSLTGMVLSINGVAGGDGDEFKLDGAGIVVRDPGNAPQAGTYTITVDMTHANFLGTLSLAVTARIRDDLSTKANEIVAADARNATITVATGYSGDGYAIPLGSDYVFEGVSLESAVAGYDDARNVITLSEAVVNPLALAATATVDCESSSRDCAPLELIISATFIPLSLGNQDPLNKVYQETFTHPLNIGGYNADRVSLVVTGIEGGADNVFALNQSGGIIPGEDNPSGESNPPAGAYTVTVEMTHKSKDIKVGFLGTLTLKVTANISRKSLDDAGFGFSPAGKTTIAAGAGAVGREVGRVELTGGDPKVTAFVQEQSAFPDQISLAFLPQNESQTVVFYLTEALSGDGAEAVKAPTLTIISANPNYSPFESRPMLTIKALRNPMTTEVNGTILADAPYNNNRVFDFKQYGNGEYQAATNFERDAETDNSTELAVDAAGIVSTNGDIAEVGTYTLAVSLTSPAFVGRARLEMRLFLVSVGSFTPDDTIGAGRRSQEIKVVPGYSGSVAFFAAGNSEVTLRTPSSAPDGFNLGEGGLDNDFKGENGFTLFLAANQVQSAGAAATAVFAVTAKAAGYTEEAIELTVSVGALTPPAAIAEPVTVGHEDESYAAIPLPEGFGIDAANQNPFKIAGVGVFDGNSRDFTGSLSDYGNRMSVNSGESNIRPVDNDNATRRLAPGRYRITVEMTHSGFLGTLTLTIPLVVETTLEPDDVVADRVVTQPVASGHFGGDEDAGYVIPVEGGYALSDFSYFSYKDGAVTVANGQIKAANAVTENLAATVAANVTCNDDDRNCAALRITLLVEFIPVAAPPQDLLSSNYGESYDHDLNAPTAPGGNYDFSASGAALTIVGVSDSGGNAVSNFQEQIVIDADYKLDSRNNGLAAGVYTIAVAMTHPGFLGTLTLTVQADIKTPVTAGDVLKAEDQVPVILRVVPGYSGDMGRTVVISNTYTLTNLEYDAGDFLVVADADKSEYVVRLANAMPSDRDLTAAVTASVACPSARNCAPLAVTLSVTFKRVTPEAQQTLNVGDNDDADYNHPVSVAYERQAAGVSLWVAGAENTETGAAVDDINSRIKIEDRRLQRVGDDANERLAVGKYRITVAATTSDTVDGFLGTLLLTIAANIQNSLDPDSVVEPRDVTVSVAVGHSGFLERVISVKEGHALTNASIDNDKFGFFERDRGRAYEFFTTGPMQNSEAKATVTADAVCIDSTGQPDADRNCAPLVVTISATFKPVSFDNVRQSALSAAETEDYDHLIILPAAYATGATLEVVDSGDLISRVTVDDNGMLQPINKDAPAQRLEIGENVIIPVRVTHPDFTGSLTVTITANIRRKADAVFNGVELLSEGQIVRVMHDWERGATHEDRTVTLDMYYHGIYRNLRVMRLTAWSMNVRGLNSSYRPPADGKLPGAFGPQGFAVRICEAAGWRVPTVGEIVGVGYGGDNAPLTTERVDGGTGNEERAPAGALEGLVVPLPSKGGDDVDAPVTWAGGYELDSRADDGYYIPVRVRSSDPTSPNSANSDVRFLSPDSARWVMCVQDTNATEKLPELAAVLLESGGQTVGNPKHRKDNLPPSFTVTATLSSTAASGENLFVGTVYSWKHKDVPTILSEARPRVSLVRSIAPKSAYTVLIEEADGDAGTKIQIRVGSFNISAGDARREALTLDASHALGITATIVVMMTIEKRTSPTHSEYAPTASSGGVLAASLGDGTGTEVRPGEQVIYGGKLDIQATPDENYYVLSWGGECAGADKGSEDKAGEAKTCVVQNVQTPTLTVSVVFGRNECRTDTTCGASETCIDPDHLILGDLICVAPLNDAIAADARTVTTYVSPTYAGSVAFFAAEREGVTLRTPAISPTGFGFETSEEFVSPDGFAVSLISPLNSGDMLAGPFTVRASLSGYLEGITPLRVEVSALAAPEQAALTASHLDADYDGLGHALSAPEGFAFADGALTVLGAHGLRFTIDADDKLQPVNAGDAARRPEVGKYAITVGMTHEDFLGTLALPVSVRMQESLLAGNVLAERERVQDAVSGHFGAADDAGHLLTVNSDYTLENLSPGAGAAVAAKSGGYEVRLLSPLGNVTTAASFEGDVKCADTSLDCGALRLSVTVYFSPLIPPANISTLDWQDYDEADFPSTFRLNVPSSQEFDDASYELVSVAHNGAPVAAATSRIFLGGASNVRIRSGDPFPALGVHVLLVKATRSGDNLNRGFLGALTLTVTVHIVRGPLLRSWQLEGGNVQHAMVTVAQGYSGRVHEDALNTEHRFAGLRTAGAVPEGFSTGVTGDGAPSGLTARVSLTGRTPAPALGTLTFEVYNTNPTSAANHDPSVRGQTMIVSVTEVLAPAQDDLIVEHQVADYNEHNLVLPGNYDVSEAVLRIAGVYDAANGALVADGTERIAVSNDGKLIRGTGARLNGGEYNVAVGMTHPDFFGELTLSVSVEIQRDREALSADAVLAERERVQDAVSGYFGTQGDRGHLLTVGSGYTLAALAVSARVSATVDANPDGYEIRLLEALGDSTVTVALEGDVECVDISRNCGALRLSVTVYFSPLIPPANISTLDWQDYDEADFPSTFRLNVPSSQEFDDASYELVSVAHNGAPVAAATSRIFLGGASNVRIRSGDPFPALGVHVLLVKATRSGDNLNRGFLGALTLTVTVHIVRGPLLRSWQLEGGNVQHAMVTVAQGYSGQVHEDALNTEHRFAGLRTAGAVPEGFSTGVTGDGAPSGLTARVSLTGRTPAPALGTLTFEVYNTNPTSAANHDPSVRGQTVIVSVTEVLAPTQNRASAGYLRGFTVDLNLPQGYAAADNKPGRALSLIVSDELSNVSLAVNAATDKLEYAPNGVVADALPVGDYTVTVALTAAGLLGTVVMEMPINVDFLGEIQGVLDSDLVRFNGSPLDIVVPYRDFISPVVVLTLGDTSISTEFAEPSALLAGGSYSVSRSDDKQTLIVRRSTDESAEALHTTSDATRTFATVVFTVTAAGNDGGGYARKVQKVVFDAIELAEPVFASSYEVVGSFPGVTVSLADVKIISPTRGSPFRDHTFYGDLATLGLMFGKESESENGDKFSVSPDTGVVIVSEINTPGSYAAVITATSSFFVGVARFTLSVLVNSRSGLIFAASNLSVDATIAIENIAERAGGPDAAVTLARVSMVYHGVRRGLHWVYGSDYYRNSAQVAADRSDKGLSGNDDWHAQSICDKGNEYSEEGWRLPTLIEMAGGVLPDAGAEFATTVKVSGTEVGQALGVFEIRGAGSAAPDAVTLTFQATGGGDAMPLSSGADLGFFAELFETGADPNNVVGAPAHVYYDKYVRVSRTTGNGRVACVKPASTEYVKPALWAELSVDDGNVGRPAVETPVITLIAADQKMTANLTLGLGLFTLRGAAAAQPVANPAVGDFSFYRLDSHDAFTVNPVAVSRGIALEVGAPNGGGVPDDGEYVLSLRFAPAGKYVGFAQVVFPKSSFDSSDETQFNVVRLTVDWTKPPVALGDSFEFGDTTIESADGVAVVTVTSAVFGGAAEGVEMKYYGTVGGLRVMYSTKNPLTPVDSSGDAYGPHLCEAGGANWRNPTLTELAMLLTGPAATNLTLTVRNSGGIRSGTQTVGDAKGLINGMPGQTSAADENLNLTFPAVTDAKKGMIVALTSDYTFDAGKFQVGSGLFDNAGEPMGLIFDASKPDQAEMDDFVGGVWVCVLETSTYDATKHSQLAGIRFEAAAGAHGVPADGDIALSVSAITLSGVSFSANAAVFTLTAKAFIFDDTAAPNSYNPVIKDLTTNLSLSVGLAGANASSFALTTSDGTDSGSDMIVISYGDADPGANNVVEIEVKPPLGAKVTLTVEFQGVP